MNARASRALHHSQVAIGVTDPIELYNAAERLVTWFAAKLCCLRWASRVLLWLTQLNFARAGGALLALLGCACRIRLPSAALARKLGGARFVLAEVLNLLVLASSRV